MYGYFSKIMLVASSICFLVAYTVEMVAAQRTRLDQPRRAAHSDKFQRFRRAVPPV